MLAESQLSRNKFSHARLRINLSPAGYQLPITLIFSFSFYTVLTVPITTPSLLGDNTSFLASDGNSRSAFPVRTVCCYNRNLNYPIFNIQRKKDVRKHIFCQRVNLKDYLMVIFKITVVSGTAVKIKLKGSTGSTSFVYLKALFCVSCSCLLKAT